MGEWCAWGTVRMENVAHRGVGAHRGDRTQTRWGVLLPQRGGTFSLVIIIISGSQTKNVLRTTALG